PIPEDPYGIAKYAMELDLKSANHLHGLNYTIFRPHNVYGERQNIADRYRNVIGIFMNQIMKDEELTVFGDGNQTRAFSHIDNVAPIIAKCVFNEKAENQVFNIGAEIPYSINKLAEIIGSCFNKIPIIKYLDTRQEVVHAFSDHKKLENAFGKQEYIDLETGIRRMTKWAI
ncbi:MAG: NAD-dependent epimerase/dehydratase family protein, partial [Bacteroidota bacterium]